MSVKSLRKHHAAWRWSYNLYPPLLPVVHIWYVVHHVTKQQ